MCKIPGLEQNETETDKVTEPVAANGLFSATKNSSQR